MTHIKNPLSVIPAASVDQDGIITPHKVNNGKGSETGSSLNGPSKYPSEVRSIINATIPPLGEEIVSKLMGGRIVPDSESKDYDIALQDNTKVEVKTARIGSTAAIRQGQLERLREDDFYSLVYYETVNNRQQSPAYHVQHCIDKGLRTSPEEYLKKKISIKTILVIARPSIVNFFNTSNLRLLHNSSNIPYKALARTNAIRLFEENPDGVSQQQGKWKYGRHDIDIYSLGKELEL